MKRYTPELHVYIYIYIYIYLRVKLFLSLSLSDIPSLLQGGGGDAKTNSSLDDGQQGYHSN